MKIGNYSIYDIYFCFITIDIYEYNDKIIYVKK